MVATLLVSEIIAPLIISDTVATPVVSEIIATIIISVMIAFPIFLAMTVAPIVLEMRVAPIGSLKAVTAIVLTIIAMPTASEMVTIIDTTHLARESNTYVYQMMNKENMRTVYKTIVYQLAYEVHSKSLLLSM